MSDLFSAVAIWRNTAPSIHLQLIPATTSLEDPAMVKAVAAFREIASKGGRAMPIYLYIDNPRSD